MSSFGRCTAASAVARKRSSSTAACRRGSISGCARLSVGRAARSREVRLRERRRRRARAARLEGRDIFVLFPHQSRYVVPPPCVTCCRRRAAARAVLAANLETAVNGVWDARAAAGRSRHGRRRRRRRLPGRVRGAATRVRRGVGGHNRAREPIANAGCPLSPSERARAPTSSSTRAGRPPATRLALRRRVRGDDVEMSWYGDPAGRVPLGEAFHARRLTIKSSQVGQWRGRSGRSCDGAPRMQLALSLLDDPALDVLITGEAPFETARGDGAAWPRGRHACHRICTDNGRARMYSVTVRDHMMIAHSFAARCSGRRNGCTARPTWSTSSSAGPTRRRRHRRRHRPRTEMLRRCSAGLTIETSMMTPTSRAATPPPNSSRASSSTALGGDPPRRARPARGRRKPARDAARVARRIGRLRRPAGRLMRLSFFRSRAARHPHRRLRIRSADRRGPARARLVGRRARARRRVPDAHGGERGGRRVLADCPPSVVLVDGLALGALPVEVDAAAARLRIVALVHHPLADETGIAEAAASLRRASGGPCGGAAVVVTSRATAARWPATTWHPRDRWSSQVPNGRPWRAVQAKAGAVPMRRDVIARKGHEVLMRAFANAGTQLAAALRRQRARSRRCGATAQSCGRGD